MVDRLAILLVDVGVQPVWLHEIHDDPELAELWRIIPRHMRLLMQHVIDTRF